MSSSSRTASPIGRSRKGKNVVPPTSTAPSTDSSLAVVVTPAPARERAVEAIRNSIVPSSLSRDDVDWLVYVNLPSGDWRGSNTVACFGSWRAKPFEELLQRKSLFKGSFVDFSAAFNHSAVVARVTIKVSGDNIFFYTKKKSVTLYYFAFPSGCPDTQDPASFVVPATPIKCTTTGVKRMAPSTEGTSSSSSAIKKVLQFEDAVGHSSPALSGGPTALAPPFIPPGGFHQKNASS